MKGRLVNGKVTCLVVFFNDTATTEIYTLSLHDALPIYHPLIQALFLPKADSTSPRRKPNYIEPKLFSSALLDILTRSEEHTSELQSRQYLVCRLLLETKHKFHLPFLLADTASPPDLTCY